jgi:hypothetical protein
MPSARLPVAMTAPKTIKVMRAATRRSRHRRQAALRHGFYTAEAKAERRLARSALVGLRAALANVD